MRDCCREWGRHADRDIVCTTKYAGEGKTSAATLTGSWLPPIIRGIVNRTKFMHLKDDNFFHLTYCSNIHPGETWMETFTNLEVYVPTLKRALAPDEPFGIGLRLSDRASRELHEVDHLRRFRTWLDAQGLYVFTLNGFPYGGFHRQVVKDRVYRPDWTRPERVEYTVRLAEILAQLLPDGIDGGISTSPISYKPWHAEDARDMIFEEAARNFAEVARRLVEVRERTGRFIHVDIEPEPDCLIENTLETASFFEQWLLPEGGKYLSEHLGIPATEAHAVLLEHIQVCYDACHFAVEYEDPAYALARLTGMGIRIGKVQVSSAVKVGAPADEATHEQILRHLETLSESTYLHQVIARGPDGGLSQYRDLPSALQHGMDGADEWRIHFHVPIFVDQFGPLSSTRVELEECLRLVRAQRVTPHLEIETYTWEVLPDALKTRLSTSILREYAWALTVLEGSPRDILIED